MSHRYHQIVFNDNIDSSDTVTLNTTKTYSNTTWLDLSGNEVSGTNVWPPDTTLGDQQGIVMPGQTVQGQYTYQPPAVQVITIEIVKDQDGNIIEYTIDGVKQKIEAKPEEKPKKQIKKYRDIILELDDE